jgi:hypothetical protein
MTKTLAAALVRIARNGHAIDAKTWETKPGCWIVWADGRTFYDAAAFRAYLWR